MDPIQKSLFSELQRPNKRKRTNDTSELDNTPPRKKRARTVLIRKPCIYSTEGGERVWCYNKTSYPLTLLGEGSLHRIYGLTGDGLITLHRRNEKTIVVLRSNIVLRVPNPCQPPKKNLRAAELGLSHIEYTDLETRKGLQTHDIPFTPLLVSPKDFFDPCKPTHGGVTIETRMHPITEELLQTMRLGTEKSELHSLVVSMYKKDATYLSEQKKRLFSCFTPAKVLFRLKNNNLTTRYEYRVTGLRPSYSKGFSSMAEELAKELQQWAEGNLSFLDKLIRLYPEKISKNNAKGKHCLLRKQIEKIWQAKYRPGTYTNPCK